MASSLSRLSGKVAVITGAASGIGLVTCQRFADEGAKVMMVDLDRPKLKSAHDSLAEAVGKENVSFACGSVVDLEFGQKTISDTAKIFGNVSTLVNAAGIIRPSPITTVSMETFREVVQVNLFGVHNFTQNLLKHLLKEKNREVNESASIVNVASLAGKTGMHNNAHYAASKSAVIAFTKTTCVEYGRFGIRCNVVLPGFTETPMADLMSGNLLKAVLRNNPMQRLGQPVEIANACLFLASNESSYVNGATLEVTGGLGA